MNLTPAQYFLGQETKNHLKYTFVNCINNVYLFYSHHKVVRSVIGIYLFFLVCTSV